MGKKTRFARFFAPGAKIPDFGVQNGHFPDFGSQNPRFLRFRVPGPKKQSYGQIRTGWGSRFPQKSGFFCISTLQNVKMTPKMTLKGRKMPQIGQKQAKIPNRFPHKIMWGLKAKKGLKMVQKSGFHM